MSKDIWHTADKTPEEDRLIVVKSKRTGEYLVGSEFEFVLDYFTKWAYFDDLLALETENKDLSDKIGKLETELEKTRKAAKLLKKIKRLKKELNKKERQCL